MGEKIVVKYTVVIVLAIALSVIIGMSFIDNDYTNLDISNDLAGLMIDIDDVTDVTFNAYSSRDKVRMTFGNDTRYIIVEMPRSIADTIFNKDYDKSDWLNKDWELSIYDVDLSDTVFIGNSASTKVFGFSNGFYFIQNPLIREITGSALAISDKTRREVLSKLK